MIPFFDASQRQKFKTTAKKCNFFIAFAKTMFSLGESYVFTLLMHSIHSVYTRLQLSKTCISYT